MTLPSWGTLAPDHLTSVRRQQTLGLAPAVRHFNDKAVPGIGGMWFPMPLLWSVLAVSIAEELRRPALPVGNAIEALMMKEARTASSADPRVRGARKLVGLEDWSFKNLSRRGVYVIQPIRMAMVQPLVSLGLVHGSRYGAFRMHEAGHEMLALPDMKGVRGILGAWARGERPRDLSAAIKALSPLVPVPTTVRKLIRARLLEGDGVSVLRRRNLVALRKGPSFQQLASFEPLHGIDAGHWIDLRAGVAVVDIRDAALSILNTIERRLLGLRDENKAARLSADDGAHCARPEIESLRRLALASCERINDAGELSSIGFVKECVTLRPSDIVRRLAMRDSSVICWRDERLCLGAAAGEPRDETSSAENTEEPANDADFAPQLFRLYNMHCLATELAGALNPGCSNAQSSEVA